MAFNIPGPPFPISGKNISGLGGFDLAQAIGSGLNLSNLYKESKYKNRNLENAAYAQELANQIKTPYAQNANRAFEADVGGQEATAGLSRENTLKQKILNQFLKQREQAEIEETKARGNYYNMGGAGGSTGSKDYNNYLTGIAADNPNLNPLQLKEAADVLAKGGNALTDGTRLNPMSIGTNLAFNRAVKATTTAAQTNQSNFANQAEAELDVFTNIADKYRKPYATTIAGKSPQQIIDSFKNDDKSQTQLGELIASNALEFDIAQVRNRIAMGQPGITSTNQMMQEAQQHINTAWPRLSQKARTAANRALNDALKKGLAARNKVGSGAGAVYTRQYTSGNSNTSTGNVDVPEGAIGMYYDGDKHKKGQYFIKPEDVDDALAEGFTYE